MNDDSKREQAAQFDQPWNVARPRPVDAMAVPDHEWRRMRRLLGKAAAPPRALFGIASAALSVAIGAAGLLISYPAQLPASDWRKIVLWVLAVSGGVIAITFFALDHKLPREDRMPLPLLLEEMDELERRYASSTSQTEAVGVMEQRTIEGDKEVQ